MSTKSDRILALLEHTEMTRAQIARDVGCLPAYVRVVEQRLAGNCAAQRWLERNPEYYQKALDYKRVRYATDPEFRERKLDSDVRYKRERYRSDPEFRQRVLETHARYRARKREAAST